MIKKNRAAAYNIKSANSEFSGEEGFKFNTISVIRGKEANRSITAPEARLPEIIETRYIRVCFFPSTFKITDKDAAFVAGPAIRNT